MPLRPALIPALLLTAAAAWPAAAADAPARPRGYSIAPGTPATVGQGGAVVGVVPHQAVPAPHGSMATFGGLLGTGAPARAPVAGAPATRTPAPGAPAPR